MAAYSFRKDGEAANAALLGLVTDAKAANAALRGDRVKDDMLWANVSHNALFASHFLYTHVVKVLRSTSCDNKFL